MQYNYIYYYQYYVYYYPIYKIITIIVFVVFLRQIITTTEDTKQLEKIMPCHICIIKPCGPKMEICIVHLEICIFTIQTCTMQIPLRKIIYVNFSILYLKPLYIVSTATRKKKNPTPYLCESNSLLKNKSNSNQLFGTFTEGCSTKKQLKMCHPV